MAGEGIEMAPSGLNHGKGSQGDERQRSERKGLLIWLMLTAPVLLLILFCGQSALIAPMMSARADTESLLQADYGPWESMVLSVVKKEIISSIRVDMLSMSYPGAALLGPLNGPGSFLLKPDLDAELQKPVLERTQPPGILEPTTNFATTVAGGCQTPAGGTVFPDQDPTTISPSPSPSHTQMPASSPTKTLTHSGTLAPSVTTTRTSTRTSTHTPTRTSAPSATSTASEGPAAGTPTASATQTPTSTSAMTATATASAAMTESATLTSTAVATATEIASGNPFWFSDQTAGTGTYRMFPSPPVGSNAQNIGSRVSFETQDFPSGAAMEAGTTRVYVYATNIFPSGRSMELEIFSGWSSLGSGQVVVPGQTLDPVLIPVTISTSAAVFQGEGRFLMLDFVLEGGVRIFWAGTDYDGSRAVFPEISGP